LRLLHGVGSPRHGRNRIRRGSLGQRNHQQLHSRRQSARRLAGHAGRPHSSAAQSPGQPPRSGRATNGPRLRPRDSGPADGVAGLRPLGKRKGGSGRTGLGAYSVSQPPGGPACSDATEQALFSFSNGCRAYWSGTAHNSRTSEAGKVLDAGSAQYQVVCDDNLNFLPSMESGSVDLAITSPPYFNQREYSSLGLGNEATAAEHIRASAEILAAAQTSRYNS